MTRTLAIVLLYSASAFGADCGDPEAKHWKTVVKLKAASVTLHWTGVYEGSDTVCRVSYKTASTKQTSQAVWGQPSVNTEQGLLAFVSCADDGCEKELQVLDVGRSQLLKAALPLTDDQFYLKASWKGNERVLLVEVESFPAGQRTITTFTCAVGNVVSCSKSGI